jgi:hypothetical protein
MWLHLTRLRVRTCVSVCVPFGVQVVTDLVSGDVRLSGRFTVGIR